MGVGEIIFGTAGALAFGFVLKQAIEAQKRCEALQIKIDILEGKYTAEEAHTFEVIHYRSTRESPDEPYLR